MKIASTNYILVTDAAEEPLTLEEVKTFLRIDGNDYDNIITPLIKTVRQLAEKIIGRDMVNKTWKTYFDYFLFSSFKSNIYPFFCPNYFGEYTVEILKSKLQSITSIKYYSNDVLTVYDSSNYYISDNSDYASIYLKSNATTPTNIDERKQAIEITFVSGYGASRDDIPQALREAMLYHIAALFENAGDCKECEGGLYEKMYYPYIITNKLFDVI